MNAASINIIIISYNPYFICSAEANIELLEAEEKSCAGSSLEPSRQSSLVNSDSRQTSFEERKGKNICFVCRLFEEWVTKYFMRGYGTRLLVP